MMSRPISVWPMAIRYLVFPQIYGYFTTEKLTSELKVVYEADHAIMVDGYDYMVSDVSLIDDTAE